MKIDKSDMKPMSPTESIRFVKDLLKKSKERLTPQSFRPGRVLMYHYDAKDKEQTYDRTPLVMILKHSKSHTLAINLHWAPVPLRVILVKKILDVNRTNIKNGHPLVFDYKDLKPFLKKVGFAPIIRLYINKRISSSGVVVPPDRLMEIARTRSETFTAGRVSAEVLYRKALQQNKTYRKGRTRRE